MKKKPDKKKEARRAMLEKTTADDHKRFTEEVSRMLDLAFPTMRAEVKNAKQGNTFILKPGDKSYDDFTKKFPDWGGGHFVDPEDNSNIRVVKRVHDGQELPFGFTVGTGTHEAGHDFIKEHKPPPHIMQSNASMPVEGEDTFESALRLALESGGQALDEEHMTQNADPFDAVRKALGYPTAADTLPSKAHKLDNMLEANPPAERYEWQSSAWEDDK